MCHVIMLNDLPLMEDGYTWMVPAVSQFHICTVVHLLGGGGGGGGGRGREGEGGGGRRRDAEGRERVVK